MAAAPGHGLAALRAPPSPACSELENEIGCFFDRERDGSLHHKAFAGQTADRTVHKGDLTGIEIINRLMEKVMARGVEKLQEHRAVGLIPARAASAGRRVDDRHAQRAFPARPGQTPC